LAPSPVFCFLSQEQITAERSQRCYEIKAQRGIPVRLPHPYRLKVTNRIRFPTTLPTSYHAHEMNSHTSGLKSDWFTTAGMSCLLVISLLFAASDFRHAFRDQVSQASGYTLIFAAYGFLLAMSYYLGFWGRAGFLLLGLCGSVRAALFYLHAGSGSQHVAAIYALVLSGFAWIMIFIAALQWFRAVARTRD
jgi:hypothetical protein